MNKVRDILLVFILGMLASAWITSFYWAGSQPPILDPRAAYCRGFIEGNSGLPARSSDEETCLNNIVTGIADLEDLGLKGPLFP